MAGDLSGAWAKWRRADAHLKDLREIAVGSITFSNEWLNQYTATPEAYRDGLEYRFYVEPEPIDTEAQALLIGDCLFNLRSALDHIVFELHRRRFRDRLPRDAEEDSAFPILRTKPDGRHGRSADPAKWREIKRLGFKQRRAIEFLQPYNRRRDEFRYLREALAEIQFLNNIDKHRHLHVFEAVAFTAPVPNYGWGSGWLDDPLPDYGFIQESFLARPLIGKTEVFRWTFDAIPPDLATELNRKHYVTAGICLYEGGEPRFIRTLLEDLVAVVETVLDRFEVFLPPR